MSETHSLSIAECQAAVADDADARRHGQGAGPKSVPVPSIERARQLVLDAVDDAETVRIEMDCLRCNGARQYIAGFVDRTFIEQRKLRQIAEAIGDGTVRTTQEALTNVRLQISGMKEACKGLKDGPALIRAFDRVLGIIANELIEAGAAR